MALGAAACSSSGSDAPAPDRTLTGTVTVKSQGKVVCVITLKGGKGSCKVNTQHYAPGTVQFSASYGGGSGFKPSQSSTVNVKLTKAAAKTAGP